MATHELQQRPYVPSSRRAPRCRTAARVHQRLQRAGDESIVHENILVNVEPAVVTFEIAGAIAVHAVTKRQILSTSRRTDRIGLYEGQRIEGALKCGGRKEAARDGESAQLVESHA